MNQRKITVTIGIPVHNEDQTLGALLSSIIKQKEVGFKINSIYVMCDMCTDKSVLIAKLFLKKDKRIKIIESKSRIGKNKQLEKLYKASESDVVVLFDGDVLPINSNVVAELVKKFKNRKVGLVGGLNIPAKPRNKTEKIISNWIEMWLTVRKNYKKGKSIHNSLGCILAIRKQIYKKITFPNFVTDDDFTFFTTLNMGYKFAFAKKAVVSYMLPTNFSDFFSQDTRVISAKKEIRKHFGEWVDSHYSIPKLLKLKVLLEAMWKKPLTTLESLIFQIIVRTAILFKKPTTKNYWKSIASSKSKLEEEKKEPGIQGGQSMGILTLLMASLKSRQPIAHTYKLPLFIREYEFFKELPKKGTKYDFRIALYKNPVGKTVFVKYWKGPENDFRYLTFLNEIRAYQTLSNVYKRQKNNLPAHISRVNIPKYIGVIKGLDYTALITEFVPGKMASEYSIEEKINAYLKSSQFIEFLGKKMTRSEKTKFGSRNAYHYITMYPVFLLLSMINFPEYSKYLLKGMLTFARGIAYLTKEEQLILTHRDLHFNNLLIYNSKIYVIDLQYVIFAHRINEYVTTLRYRWGMDGMEKYFVPQIAGYIQKRYAFEKIFNGMMVNSVTQGLTDKSYKGERSKRWIELLKIAASNATIYSYK